MKAEQELESVRVPTLKLPLHARILRASLLASPRFRHSRISFAHISHLMKTLVLGKKTVFAGSFIAIAAVLVFGLGNFNGKSIAYAEAKEFALAAEKKIAFIDNDVRINIENSIQMDMEASLADALSSKDLRRLNPEAYLAEFGNSNAEESTIPSSGAVSIENAPIPAFPITVTNTIVQDGTTYNIGTIDAANVTKKIDATVSDYLVYTNAEGRKIALGFNAESVLVARIMKIE